MKLSLDTRNTLRKLLEEPTVASALSEVFEAEMADEQMRVIQDSGAMQPNIFAIVRGGARAALLADMMAIIRKYASVE
jgi:hypothetical protein